MNKIRVTLVEDHVATRAALAQILFDASDRLEVLALFSDAEALLASPILSRIHVALVDLGLPDMHGCNAIESLQKKAPHVRCVALTVLDDEDTVFAAMRAGAWGYLLKDEPEERLLQAIEDASVGKHPVSSAVAGFLIAQARSSQPQVMLTERERELANLLANGASYSECAERMAIAIGTVQDYVKSLYRKTDVCSKKELREWVARSRMS